MFHDHLHLRFVKSQCQYHQLKITHILSYLDLYFSKVNLSDLRGIIKVHVDTWKTAYHRIISEDFLQSLSYEEKEANWRQRLEKPTHGAIIYVAEADQNEIIGFALATLEIYNPIVALLEAERYNGELCAIYVLKEFQRKKIGTELVHMVVKYFILNNIYRMITWVLKESPYRRFYEKLGSKYIGGQFLEIGGRKYSEVAYAWENINKILLK
ncbi:hypothetical protein LCGC14_1311010 [marine sediment metagenome]|uniref:N-acetyltransferase domain-containing protein n=1 Tax=marine sediment metagenome TaxID=412755 RepID=A0A0F9KMW2_9ZZZZ